MTEKEKQERIRAEQEDGVKKHRKPNKEKGNTVGINIVMLNPKLKTLEIDSNINATTNGIKDLNIPAIDNQEKETERKQTKEIGD